MYFAPLAQLAEHVTLNHQVEGSIPSRCIAKIAQLVERQPEELGVGGSTPSLGIKGEYYESSNCYIFNNSY